MMPEDDGSLASLAMLKFLYTGTIDYSLTDNTHPFFHVKLLCSGMKYNLSALPDPANCKPDNPGIDIQEAQQPVVILRKLAEEYDEDGEELRDEIMMHHARTLIAMQKIEVEEIKEVHRILDFEENLIKVSNWRLEEAWQISPADYDTEMRTLHAGCVGESCRTQ